MSQCFFASIRLHEWTGDTRKQMSIWYFVSSEQLKHKVGEMGRRKFCHDNESFSVTLGIMGPQNKLGQIFTPITKTINNLIKPSLFLSHLGLPIIFTYIYIYHIYMIHMIYDILNTGV